MNCKHCGSDKFVFEEIIPNRMQADWNGKEFVVKLETAEALYEYAHGQHIECATCCHGVDASFTLENTP